MNIDTLDDLTEEENNVMNKINKSQLSGNPNI